MFVTTSKNASNATKKFAIGLSNILPLAYYYGRGKRNLTDIIKHVQDNLDDKLIIVTEINGEPNLIKVINIDLSNNSWGWFSSSIKIKQIISFQSIPRSSIKPVFDNLKYNDLLIKNLFYQGDNEFAINPVQVSLMDNVLNFGDKIVLEVDIL